MLTEIEIKNKNRNWTVITEPSVEPISVDELKTYARIDTDQEDDLLTDIIQAVRESMEFYLGRALVEQTLMVSYDYWPNRVIELPQPPLISVTGVYNVNEDGASTVYSASNYYVVTEAIPGQIALRQGADTPDNTGRDTSGHRIYFTAGYGSQASDVPATIRVGLKQWATMAYETRAINTFPPDEVKQSLDLFRVIKL